MSCFSLLRAFAPETSGVCFQYSRRLCRKAPAFQEQTPGVCFANPGYSGDIIIPLSWLWFITITKRDKGIIP